MRYQICILKNVKFEEETFLFPLGWPATVEISARSFNLGNLIMIASWRYAIKIYDNFCSICNPHPITTLSGINFNSETENVQQTPYIDQSLSWTNNCYLESSAQTIKSLQKYNTKSKSKMFQVLQSSIFSPEDERYDTAKKWQYRRTDTAALYIHATLETSLYTWYVGIWACHGMKDILNRSAENSSWDGAHSVSCTTFQNLAQYCK